MKKENIERVLFYIILLLMIVVMLFYIGKKEGYHEDEMFSYGSSNHAYDNLFHSYGEYDSVNRIIQNDILKPTIEETFSKIQYYVTNMNTFQEKLQEEEKENIPSWRTKEEARKYMTVSKNSQFNFASVYYNQTRDVHPPLFYFLTNIISSVLKGEFTKYIIFGINLCFIIACLEQIRQIFKLLGKEKQGLFACILYALSMGAISTVMFQRMYTMLTFFTIYYLKLTIILYQNQYQMDKPLKRKYWICVLFGFLTQYYFCIYVVFMVAIVSFCLMKKKKYQELKSYILQHIKIALVGILVFPASIYHIFFSYRGVGNIQTMGYITRILEYFKVLCKSFSIESIAVLAVIMVLIGYGITVIQSKKKELIFIFTLPVLLYWLVIVKISPYIELRYIMNILPILAICCILGIDRFLKNKVVCFSALSVLCLGVSIYGIATQKPLYLYQGYQKYLTIAEENSSTRFVYIGDTDFNYIQSMPEFMIYEKSFIVNSNKGEIESLKQDPLKQEDFIVSIKKYLPVTEILQKVMEYTEHTRYEMLEEGNNDTGCVVYRIIK